MDIFNKKKLANLQTEIQTATLAKENAEQLHKQLSQAVIKMCKDLETYFQSQFVGKYLKYTNSNNAVRRVKCTGLRFAAGTFALTVESPDGTTSKIGSFTPVDLIGFKFITKKEFLKEEQA